MAKTMYKVASKVVTTRKKNGGEDPPKRGTAPLPGDLKAPSGEGLKVPSANSLPPIKERIKAMNEASAAKAKIQSEKVKATSQRYKKEPTYNVRDAAKRNPNNLEAIEKDLKNTRAKMGAMYQEGKINRRQLKDSIRSTYDLGTPKSKIKSEVKSIGGKTKAGQVLYKMGVGKNKAKSGGLTMKAETRQRSCSKPGKGF